MNDLYFRIREHFGHDIEIAQYGLDDNYAVECCDCGQIIVDQDRPDPAQVALDNISNEFEKARSELQESFARLDDFVATLHGEAAREDDNEWSHNEGGPT